MRAALIYRSGMAHQVEWCGHMRAGLEQHGVEVVEKPDPGEPVITWGWKQARPWREVGHDVLVMERGQVGDRKAWCSLGWNGLQGRGIYPAAQDQGERWREHFGDLMKPWRGSGAYVLLLGQVQGDQAAAGVNLAPWYDEAVAALRERDNRPVVFRPHPIEVDWGRETRVRDAPTLRGSLHGALEHAALAVTWNSTSAVEAVLAGVPTVACDEGCPAWPVTAHGLDAATVWPSRESWAHRLAWRQYSADEIASGVAWEQLAACRPS